MSFELPTQRKAVAAHSRWAGASFLVEAMLLLVFVAASLAVFTSMLAASSERATESRYLTDAVAVATSTAEHFSADPTHAAVDRWQDGMHVICQVTPEERDGGTIYYATIDVYGPDSTGQPLYSVSTAKYMNRA